MPPKKRTESSSSSNNIFQYNNTVELTFKPDSNKKLLVKTKTVGDSSDEDDAPILKKKKGRRRGKKDTCSSSSSSSSDTSSSSSDSENGKPGDELKKYDIHEICDDDFDELPRPLTPPPSNTNAPTSGPSRQAKKLSRTVGEKMRYLQFLQKQDVASPVAATPNVFDVGDNYGSPNNFQHKMTVRIRTRNGVRRFQLKMNETFEEIFNNLATMHEATTDLISLSFTDGLGNLQMLKFTDTPSKVNLSVADIIDCVVVNRTTIDESVEMSENVVNIKIQGSESKSVKHFKALKNKSLGRIMQLYAEFRQLPLSKLKFFFDGEKILPEQTPNDLDMDDENAVDVKLI